MPRIRKSNSEPIMSFHQKSDSDLSTISTVDFAKQCEPAPSMVNLTTTRRHNRRAVHFNETARVCIVQRVTEQESVNVWYTREDFATFHAQTQMILHQQNKSDPQWSAALVHVYRAFRGQVLSQAQLVRIVDQATALLDLNEDNVGLHAYAHNDLTDDFAVRRQHLMQQVHRLQTQVANVTVRQEMIAETSRLTSHVARMFAGYIALVAVCKVQNKRV